MVPGDRNNISISLPLIPSPLSSSSLLSISPSPVKLQMIFLQTKQSHTVQKAKWKGPPPQTKFVSRRFGQFLWGGASLASRTQFWSELLVLKLFWEPPEKNVWVYCTGDGFQSISMPYNFSNCLFAVSLMNTKSSHHCGWPYIMVTPRKLVQSHKSSFSDQNTKLCLWSSWKNSQLSQ